MRQRVTLARTFIPQPHIILLDEPLIGLDPAGRIQLRKILSMLREQGCAMIVSSHILSDLEEVATHIAIIEQGRILRWGKTESLQHQHEDRRTYRLAAIGMNSELATAVSAMEGTSEVVVDGNICTFDYLAGDEAAAGLLKTLVDRGVPVASFGVVKRTLEEAYLRSGVKQVD